MNRGIGFVLVAGWAMLANGSAPAGEPQVRCAKDALEKWYCATDARGVAVVDNLGVLSGGGATLTPDGPVCEGGCRAPRAVDCEHGMGPA